MNDNFLQKKKKKKKAPISTSISISISVSSAILTTHLQQFSMAYTKLDYRETLALALGQ